MSPTSQITTDAQSNVVSFLKYDTPQSATQKPIHNESPTKGLSVDSVLSMIAPVKQWEDNNGQKWSQQVSNSQSSRQEVLQLQSRLDQELQTVPQTAMCPERTVLFKQAFDELLRQTTVSCAERGLLMVKVRNQLYADMDTLETLYESGVAYGIRKSLLAEQMHSELELKVETLEQEKIKLTQQSLEYKAKAELTEKREVERRSVDDRKHADEVAYLKKLNTQLKAQLEATLTQKK